MVTFLPWWVTVLLLNLGAVLVGVVKAVREDRGKRARRAEVAIAKVDAEFRRQGFVLAEAEWRQGWLRDTGEFRWEHPDGRYAVAEW